MFAARPVQLVFLACATIVAVFFVTPALAASGARSFKSGPIQITADGSSVWVVEAGAVRRQAVDVGPTRGDRIEVRQGLSGGETLVLDPPAELKDGIKVKLAGR